MDTHPHWQWIARPDESSWRRDWHLWSPHRGGAYYARHASGLVFELYYDSLDETDTDQGWMVCIEEDSEPLADRTNEESPGSILILQKELMALWRELGFKDDIRSGMSRN